MSTTNEGGPLYSIYRDRIGQPQTDDEVRGYWVFLVGLLLAAVGLVLFLPSESAVGADGITLREISIILAAIGLAMLVAGPVIRLPLQSWANLAAYLGQLVSFAAVVWFTTVFPADWSVQTGSQPVIILYAVGLAIILVGGVLAPLLSGVTREDLEASEGRTAQLQERLDAVREERDQLESQLDEQGAASEGAAAEHEAELASLYTSQAQFELYADTGDKYRWRLRHRNGNIIADSSQGYTRKHNAQKGLASVRRNALGASLLHVEPEPDEDPEEAVDDAPLIPAVEESKADFEAYEDSEGKHRWRLVHDNGNVIADSGQGYASGRNVDRAIESVRENAAAADYLQFDPTSFEIYRDAGGEWRWRLIHKNGNIIASASEGYTRRRDAKRSVDSIREGVEDGNFEVYEDDGGDHRWRLTAGNNEVIATGGEGYSSMSECERAVERVRKYAPDADALDVGIAAFEVYEDEAEEWRWRLRHRNGKIVADGGEGYAERTGCQDAIESVKKNAPGADVTDE
jgi:uncharacterized protein YegP (UPF0339 family)